MITHYIPYRPEFKHVDFLLGELNKNTPNIELVFNDRNLSLDFLKSNLGTSFCTDIAQNEIYKILSSIDSVSDINIFIKSITKLESLIISLNVQLSHFIMSNAQKDGDFSHGENYFLTFDYQSEFKKIRTITNYIHCFKVDFNDVYVKDSIEQLKSIADFLFLAKAILDTSCFPFIRTVEKLALNKIIKWFLTHLKDAVIHKVIIEQNPVSSNVEVENRKATDNTTRLTLYYQIQNEYPYKIRIDLPHVGVDLPHLNFYFLHKEMIGPIPEAIAKKYSGYNVTYKDSCDNMYYFDPLKKTENTLIRKEVKSLIKEYRHKNILITDWDKVSDFNSLFDNLITYLYSKSFFTLETTHKPDDTGDEAIFKLIKNRGVMTLISFLTFQQHDTSKILKDMINGYSESDLEGLNNEELLFFLHEELYK
ncbi:MAG: hypothetical protein WBG43_03345 [Marinifilaceae bacterium]